MFESFTFGKQLPPDLVAVMGKLKELYGDALVVTSLNAQGATFYVRHLSDEVLIRQMMAQKAAIFGPDVEPGTDCVLGPLNFQILKALATQPTPGLTMRYLPNTPNGDDYLTGFWYC
jgi:hypothetical protein